MLTTCLQRLKQPAISLDTMASDSVSTQARTDIGRTCQVREHKDLVMRCVDGFSWGIVPYLRGLSSSLKADDRAFESHFIQAQKVRRLIQFSFDDVFKAGNMLHRNRTRISPHRKCDILICPTTVGPAPELATISSLTPVETYVNDVFTVPGSLAGLPAISIPVQVDGHIVGLQLVGQVATDSLVLQAAKELETLLQ